MKVKPFHHAGGQGQQPKPKRTPRVAVVRPIDRERPTRIWSLLLPPTFPSDRK
jgi:hypothetical protein